MDPSEKFKEHHQRLIDDFRKHYEEAREGGSEALNSLVNCLTEEILPHAQAEEDELYGRIDDSAGTDLATASMRADHVELERRIGGLEAFDGNDSGSDPIPKLDEFAALLIHHFHKEEDVLLPYLTEELSTEEFESILGAVHEAEENN